MHNLACLCTPVIKIHSRTRFYSLIGNVVAQMEMDDEFLDLLGVRAALGRRLRDAALLQRLEAAVAHRFPQRSAGRGFGAALVAAPLPGERNISEVTDAAVRVSFFVSSFLLLRSNGKGEVFGGVNRIIALRRGGSP